MVMKEQKRFSWGKISFARKAIRASATSLRGKNIFHIITEIDISLPRALLNSYKKLFGNKPSLTAYIVKCFSNSIEHFHGFNAFIIGNRIVYLKDTTITVLVERKIGAQYVPEPMAIEGCQTKTFLEISEEIRHLHSGESGTLGTLSGMPWLTLIPGFLLGLFIKLASRSIKIGIKSGKLAVTSIGMFSKEPGWVIPHGSATVLLSVGSIIKRPVEIEGRFETREHLCLTMSFDHDVIDGSPAARFMSDLAAEIRSGNEISKMIEEKKAGSDLCAKE